MQRKEFKVGYSEELSLEKITHTELREFAEEAQEACTIYHGTYELVDDQGYLTGKGGEWLYCHDGFIAMFAVGSGGAAAWTDALPEGPVERRGDVFHVAERLIDIYLNEPEEWEALC